MSPYRRQLLGEARAIGRALWLIGMRDTKAGPALYFVDATGIPEEYLEEMVARMGAAHPLKLVFRWEGVPDQAEIARWLQGGQALATRAEVTTIYQLHDGPAPRIS